MKEIVGLLFLCLTVRAMAEPIVIQATECMDRDGQTKYVIGAYVVPGTSCVPMSQIKSKQACDFYYDDPEIVNARTHCVNNGDE